MEKKKERLPYWDNLKGFLILLVVFGHLLQLTPNGSESAVYKLIYLFHMSLFVFCSGALSSFSPKKMLKSLLLPYILLQIVCCVCTGQSVQLSTPYWMLWYLPALIVWRMCIPLLNHTGKKAALAVVALITLFGCFVGYIDAIGYAYTLSRIFVFAPYFVVGYYAKRFAWFRPEQIPSVRTRATFGMLALTLSVVFILFTPQIRTEWLYGTYGYASGGYNVFFRAAHYAAAAILGFAILLFTPRIRTFFTALGHESFALYIAHIALLPMLQGVFPHLTPRLQYVVCIAAALAFCAVVPILITQVTRLKALRKNN